MCVFRGSFQSKWRQEKACASNYAKIKNRLHNYVLEDSKEAFNYSVHSEDAIQILLLLEGKSWPVVSEAPLATNGMRR